MDSTDLSVNQLGMYWATHNKSGWLCLLSWLWISIHGHFTQTIVIFDLLFGRLKTHKHGYITFNQSSTRVIFESLYFFRGPIQCEPSDMILIVVHNGISFIYKKPRAAFIIHQRYMLNYTARHNFIVFIFALITF